MDATTSGEGVSTACGVAFTKVSLVVVAYASAVVSLQDRRMMPQSPSCVLNRGHRLDCNILWSSS